MEIGLTFIENTATTREKKPSASLVPSHSKSTVQIRQAAQVCIYIDNSLLVNERVFLSLYVVCCCILRSFIIAAHVLLEF